MDLLRILPMKHMLVVSKVNDTRDEARELMRLTIDSPEDLEEQTLKLVRWALQMQVGIELPFQKEMVSE